jgi:hypothetical protein
MSATADYARFHAAMHDDTVPVARRRSRAASAVLTVLVLLTAHLVASDVDMPAGYVDQTVCYASQAWPGVWLSDYTSDGYCAFSAHIA